MISKFRLYKRIPLLAVSPVEPTKEEYVRRVDGWSKVDGVILFGATSAEPRNLAG
ncbi:MAG: hypothetical protein ACHQUB_02000 [Candidatus Saccharimonadia bacterium]